ncbi:cell division protein FtsZ [Penaeicola halotolerans]|uniref:cell division protein FtsZ n=1 Tax=Penaeicola halotolerans TaxID=2793196 RepID=UPI001CF8E2CC|nr:cell division protein FtsZ [Penaeicola halotolerans]
MSENAYRFEIPKNHKSIIKVIGVGGGGSNAVNHMYNQGIKDVEFVICNTDAQALKSSPVPLKLQIGANLTEGLGAGANPEKGRNAALESKEEIRDLLSDNTKMVFITAGMGGGTGTGAAPVIAKVAKELDILTVGIVTAPFGFEGKRKMAQAENGIRELRENCDTVLVILNDKLREVYGNLGIRSAFAKADNILTTAAKSIAEIITVHGDVNVDFEDVKTVMYGAGAAVMGSSEVEGENRALRAAEEAITSPLLNNVDINGAQKILLSILSGEEEELQMDELSAITEYIQEKAGDEADMIFGHGVDPELGRGIRVTVIATGFESNPLTARSSSKKVIDLESGKQTKLFDEAPEQSTEGLKPGTAFSFDFPKPTTVSNQVNESKQSEESDAFDMEEDEQFTFEIKQKPADSPVEQLSYYEERKKLAMERAMERYDKLKEMRPTQISSEDFKEKLEKPAYLRKNVKLNNVQPSNEENISRFNLTDDNEILGNNRFLYDNVD